jgi:hypothetical protein
VASLLLVGVALAGFTAPLAWRRTGVAMALPFIAAAIGLAVVATGVLRANRVALVLATAGLGGQILGVIGSAYELAQGVHSAKARELRRLGVDPTLGVALNLAYSVVASGVFVWVAGRWLKRRQLDAR